MARRRLEEVVVERGLAPSREKAAALIMAGRVRVDGEVVTKAGTAVAEEADVSVTGGPPYASRGGEKLAAALEVFDVAVAGRVALDVGASTGGFTSCLLARGASHVHALDVGRGLLAWELRVDSRVTVWEGVNARKFDGGALEPAPALAVVDVSFIGLEKVLRPLVPTLAALEEIVALVKPQFEARRGQVERGGVVRDPEVHRDVISAAAALLDELDFAAGAVVRSPLEGPAGNREFFLHGRRGAARRELGAEISRAVGLADS